MAPGLGLAMGGATASAAVMRAAMRAAAMRAAMRAAAMRAAVRAAAVRAAAVWSAAGFAWPHSRKDASGHLTTAYLGLSRAPLSIALACTG